MHDPRISRPLAWLLIACMLLPATAPAPAYAQETPLEPAAVNDVTQEPPVVLIASGVSSYDAPSPGVFWMEESYCAPVPPRLAGGEAEPAASAPDTVEPAAPDAATPFAIRRTTYGGLESRYVQYRPDPSGGAPSYCPGMYKVNSNVVANQTHVYWVDDSGLVRVPVNAHYGIAPQLVDGTWRSDERVMLNMVDNLLLGTLNRNAGPPPLGALGFSSVETYDTTTGEFTTPGFNFGFNDHFNSPNFDGTYIFFRKGVDLFRVNPDGTGETLVASNVNTYNVDGSRIGFCSQLVCPITHYVFYSKSDGVIYRHNFKNGEIAGIQTRAGRTIHSIVLARLPGVGSILLGPRLFWIESSFVPGGGPFGGGNYTFSLMRSGLSGGASIDNLYNTLPISAPVAPDFGDLISNDEFLLWREVNTVKRLPNDVAALPKVDMFITGYEVTQAVQTDANDVLLVKGRNTYVRVFVQSAGVDVANVTMRLGSSQGGSLSPINMPFITVKGAPNRNVRDDSFLFLLPHAWTLNDSITLNATLNPLRLPFEPNYANNAWTSPPIAFNPAYPLKLVLFEANYKVLNGVQENGWDVTDASASLEYIRRAYPIAEDGLQYQIRTINGGLLLGNHVLQTAATCRAMSADNRNQCAADWVIAKIGEMASNPAFGIPGDAYLYGLINTGAAFVRGKAGGRIGAGPTGTSLTWVGVAPNQTLVHSDFGYYTGHEVGHMLGRGHPLPNSDDPNTPDPDPPPGSSLFPVVEGCGHSRDDKDFPYPLAAIGYGDGKIRGLDRAHYSGSGWPTPAVLNDVDSADMMSYCLDSQLRWPSPYTWKGMYEWLRDHQAVVVAEVSAPQGGDFVGIFGSLYANNVAVHSVARMAAAAPTAAGSSKFAVRLLGATGNELAKQIIAAPEHSDGGAPFSVVIPLAAGTRTIQIVRAADNSVLYATAVSASAPVVASVTLPGAPSPVDGTVNVAWSASDADGGALTYDLYYSWDSGATWQPVGFGLTGSSAPVDTTVLGGGTGIFRVVASDGVNQGSAESAPFTMAVKPPRVEISTPADGQVLNWQQMVNLSGVAYDQLDGPLSGGSVAWSNQYGALGSGASINTTELAAGINVLTMTATNSAGLSASDVVTVTVGDALESPAPTLATSPALVQFQFEDREGAPTTLNRSLQLSNIGDLSAMPWTATSSASWLTLGAANGTDVPATLQLTATLGNQAPNVVHEAYVTITTAPPLAPAQVVVVPVTMVVGSTFVGPQPTGGAEGSLRVWLPLVDR